MKGIGILFLLSLAFVAGLLAGLYLTGYSPGELGPLLKDKLQELSAELITPTPVGTATPAPTARQPTPSPRAATPTPTQSLPMMEVYNTGALGLRVRSTPAVEEGNVLGKVFDGTRFSIIGGPTTASGYQWLKVRMEGWSASNWFQPVPSVGATVTVKETGNFGLRVRDGAGLDANVLGKVYDGTRLQVLDGPVSSSGFQWWRVRLEGWAASDYLREPVGQSEVSPEPGTGEAKPSAEELNKRIERLQRLLVSRVQTRSLPSEGFTLIRMLAPHIIERSDQFYFLSLDYDLLAIKSLGFARTFLKQGDNALSAEYIDRSYRYLKLSHSMEQASIEQLLAATDISQDLVVIMAGETLAKALCAFTGPIAVQCAVGVDIASGWIDYSVDRAVKEMPVETALKRELTKFVVKQVFNVPAVKDVIGEPVTKFVGRESGLYQRLEQTMLTPEVRQEIMRAVAKQAQSWVIKGAEVDATWLANQVVNRLEEAVTGK